MAAYLAVWRDREDGKAYEADFEAASLAEAVSMASRMPPHMELVAVMNKEFLE